MGDDDRGRQNVAEWLSFFARAGRRNNSVKGLVYVPSPAEIQARCAQVRWLEDLGFPRRFIVNVMELDHPLFKRVEMMVERYGPEETHRRCRVFLFPTEYDDMVEEMRWQSRSRNTKS